MTGPIIQAIYPDAELICLAVVGLLDGTNGGPVEDLTTTTFLWDDWSPPLIQVNRIGGAPDNMDVTDYPIMRIAAYGENRMAAWNLAGLAEGLMIGMRGRSVHVPEYDTDAGETWVLIDSVDIAVGGQQLPDVDPDDRRVVKDYVLGMRRLKLPTSG
jgi:hypothetical protein